MRPSNSSNPLPPLRNLPPATSMNVIIPSVRPVQPLSSMTRLPPELRYRIFQELPPAAQRSVAATATENLATFRQPEILRRIADHPISLAELAQQFNQKKYMTLVDFEPNSPRLLELVYIFHENHQYRVKIIHIYPGTTPIEIYQEQIIDIGTDLRDALDFITDHYRVGYQLADILSIFQIYKRRIYPSLEDPNYAATKTNLRVQEMLAQLSYLPSWGEYIIIDHITREPGIDFPSSLMVLLQDAEHEGRPLRPFFNNYMIQLYDSLPNLLGSETTSSRT